MNIVLLMGLYVLFVLERIQWHWFSNSLIGLGNDYEYKYIAIHLTGKGVSFPMTSTYRANFFFTP